jgi:hypothetical protein
MQDLLDFGNNYMTCKHPALYIDAIAKHIRRVFLYLQTCWYQLHRTISAAGDISKLA